MIELLKGDCFELMASIPDKSIDLIVTDPPYLHVTGGNSGKTRTSGIWKNDSFTNSSMSSFDGPRIMEFLDLADKKLKKTNMFVFCSRLQLLHYFQWIGLHKKKYDLLVWDKQLIRMKSTKFFTSDIEYIVRIYEDGVSLNKVLDEHSNTITECYSKVYHGAKPKSFHETEKPVELIKRYVLVGSKQGDVVLDPFMGSGSTGVACNETGRSFFGIEKEEFFFNTAKERIENVHLVKKINF